MFGYVQINQPELKMKDYDKYRSYYCGLCYTLKSRYGRDGQLLLNYDMTFLTLLLDSLYECASEESKRRCIVHPVTRHMETISEPTEYAADMTILLAYQKAVDDWKDERSYPKRALALLLHKDYKRLRERYPRQAKTLERCVKELSRAESQQSMDIDYVSGLTGQFLGEIFAWKDDIWAEDLKELGFYLGKFIYLMDAYDDLEQDNKKNRYNILTKLEAGNDTEFFDDVVRSMLEDTMARCARAFERLPIIRNADIARNILYSGVWLKCAAVLKQRQIKRQNVGKEK